MKTQWMQSKHPKEPMLPSREGRVGESLRGQGSGPGGRSTGMSLDWAPDPGRWLK